MCKKMIYLISLVLVLGLLGNASADLVAHWPLDADAKDIFGGHDGTLVGGAQLTDDPERGRVLSVDGIDGRVEIPHSDELVFGPADSFTIAVWLNIRTLPGSWAGIVTKSRDMSPWYGLWVTPDNQWHFVGGEGGTNVRIDTGTAMTGWLHLAGVYDANRNTQTLYVNGAVFDEYTGVTIATSGAGDVWFGGAKSVTEFLDALIDDVRIYNHALTVEEIQAVMLSVGEGYPYALAPNPDDGAMNEYTYVSLQWRPGDFAVSHNVYLGDNFDDVNDGTCGTFQGNYTDPLFFAGFTGYPYPDGLVPGMTYYWRIDEVNDLHPDSPWKGKVWSFWVPLKKAYEPNPSDGAKFVDPDVTLRWTAGIGAIRHTVYFGDDFDTVNNATDGTSVGFTYYSPGPLEYEKTYYWRVDERDTLTTHKGDVWSFTTTLPGLGTAVSERWENISGDDLDTLKDYWKYPNNPDVTEVLTQFSWDGPDIDNYGGRIHGWLYVPATGDYTFWLCSDDQGELWLSTDDDSSNIRLIASESTWSPVNSWGTGEEQSDPISLVGGNKYYIMALWKEGGGGDHCQVAWQGLGVPTRTIIPGTNLSPYEPLKAYGAKPTNNATGVTQTPILEWKPGLQAASHEVYFGTDKDAVENATKTSPQYKGTRALGDESFNPGKLTWESTYYWRIDEVNNINPDSPWIGSVWSFTTASFLIIDDFEDYDAGENQIWYAWRDGLGFGAIGTPPYSPGNGTDSAVGDETTPSYTEEVIVHGGRQSMPYWYDNKPDKAKYSEAKMTMGANARDWTDGGVRAMSLWFQGYPASVGSFTESPAGTYTMTASGYDIWFNADDVEADEFHFAYKTLSGQGSIVAKVESVQNTNGWAKAGVMIRETLDPNSAHAMMVVTPGQGVSFQRRPGTGATSEHTTMGGITAPHWVKLERDLAGNFTAYHSTDGSTWQMQGTPQNIPMSTNVYIGLALTAHNAAATCEAVFSSVTITDQVGQQWINQDIGIQSNAPEPMYVALANSTSPPAVVYHDDPNAAQIDTWTEWNIDLKEFADKSVSLADVNSIAIGFGDRNNPQAGGSGKMYFDDIRLYRPRYIPGMGTPLPADLNTDGVVDMADLEIMVADWLATGPALAGDMNTDSTVDFKDYVVLADMWLEEQLWPE